MKVQLTTEQSNALKQSSGSLSLVDPGTGKVYVLVDVSIHQRAMEALQLQQNGDDAAVQQGLDDMHAGRGMSVDESRARTEDALSRMSQ